MFMFHDYYSRSVVDFQVIIHIDLLVYKVSRFGQFTFLQNGYLEQSLLLTTQSVRDHRTQSQWTPLIMSVSSTPQNRQTLKRIWMSWDRSKIDSSSPVKTASKDKMRNLNFLSWRQNQPNLISSKSIVSRTCRLCLRHTNSPKQNTLANTNSLFATGPALDAISPVNL